MGGSCFGSGRGTCLKKLSGAQEANRAILLEHFKDRANEYIQPEPLPDGFPVPLDLEQYIESAAAFVDRNILPESGGWNQQPRRWTEFVLHTYLPGLNRAKFEALPEDDKKLYTPKKKPKPIPEDGEW